VGWQDRDYSDGSYGEPVSTTWGIRRPPGATLALMILHGVAFLLMLALQHGDGQAIAALLPLSGSAATPLGILLHPLGNASFFTALFVVLAFWSLGGRLELRLGVQRLIAVYVLGNLAAGAAYFGVARGLPALAAMPLDYPVGALAGLCAVAWQRLRDDAVQVLGRVTSAAKVYAICGAIVVGLAILEAREGAAAWLAGALAGGVSAWLFMYWPGPVRFRRRATRQVVRPSIPRSVLQPPPAEPDIDDLLAKISRQGIASLTDAERQRLETARRAKLRRSQR
jgi:membrane associated rhomboid family serine protease